MKLRSAKYQNRFALKITTRDDTAAKRNEILCSLNKEKFCILFDYCLKTSIINIAVNGYLSIRNILTRTAVKINNNNKPEIIKIF